MSAPRFTDRHVRAVLTAVAGWTPRGTSIELVAEDRTNLREQITEELAKVLGVELERALVRMESLAMAGESADELVAEWSAS